MQHVQPRFESLATPRRRYVCLLRPIALELAIKAGDARLETKIQKRAEHALTSMMEAKDVFAAGLAGDYGEVCVEFLRCFDVHDHDPATAARQVDDFTNKLRLLFVDGAHRACTRWCEQCFDAWQCFDVCCARQCFDSRISAALASGFAGHLAKWV